MDIFSNLQVVGECLLDKRRTIAFKNAIFEIIKKDDIVLDAGTGSGIMALFSAKAGAKKVYGVEIASDIAKVARENTKTNGYNNIEIIEGDVTTLKFNKQINVVILEMLDTGLIAEQQKQAINNLLNKGIINKNTRIIPFKIESYIELLDYNFNFYDFEMPFVIQARNYGANKHIRNIMSKNEKYDSVVLNQEIKEKVEKKIKIEVISKGCVNAVRLRSRIFLSSNIKIWGTSDVCMPVVIPIDNKQNVTKGQVVTLNIKYRRGFGFENVGVNLKK